MTTTFRIGSSVKSQHKGKESSTVRRRLREVRANDQIQDLHVWNVDVTEIIVKDMEKLLIRDGRQFRSIHLLHCTGHSHIASLVQMICDYSSVTSTLVLSGTSLNDDTLHAIKDGLATNQSIQTLKLLGGQFLLDNTFEGLTRNATLRELDVTKSHLTPGAAHSLADALARNQTLRILRLEDCGLEDMAMAELLKAIISNGSSGIHKLDLSHNHAHTHTLEALAQLFQSTSSSSCQLRTLNLSSQQPVSHNDNDPLTSRLTAVLAALATSSVTHLNLSGNPFLHHTTVVEALAQCLSVNTSLYALDITDTHLTDAGIERLAHHFHAFSSTSMKVLNLLGGNNDQHCLTERAAKSLVEGLRHNRILESLGDMDDNTTSWAPMMQHFLDLNRAGRRALQNDIPLAVWPQLLARAADLPCGGRNETILYSLLRGPALSF
jgi:hypothetical protein